VEVEAIQRARARLTSLRSGETTKSELTEVVTRAREELEELSKTAAELKVTVPIQVSDGIREAIHAEVVPVARHIAEIRGLSAQVVKRVESAQSAIAAEREARIDDLDVIVDLLVSNWQGLDTRLSRIEERLEERATPAASDVDASSAPELDDAVIDSALAEPQAPASEPALGAFSEQPPPQTSAVG
jgi:hypothetical protein